MAFRNQKLSVSAQQNDVHKRILTGLLRQEENRRCADCHARGPTWASVNLGVFVCLNCSGDERMDEGRVASLYGRLIVGAPSTATHTPSQLTHYPSTARCTSQSRGAQQ